MQGHHRALTHVCVCAALRPVSDRASAVLRNETAVDAVELFDRASLRECEADENMTRLVRGGGCSQLFSPLG